MSNPRPESRIKSLELRASTIEASIEEMSSDQAESSKALFEHVQRGFSQAHTYIQENIATKQDISRLETRIDRMQDDIADIKATQEEILDLLRQRPVE